MIPSGIVSRILAVFVFATCQLAAQTECGCSQTGSYLRQHTSLIDSRAFDSADSLANTLKDEKCRYLAEFAHADVLFRKSDYSKSEKVLLDSWIWISDDGCHDSLRAMFYFLLAKDFHQTNRKDSAVDFQLRCTEICEFHGFNELLYKSYANLGIMLSDMDQPAKAVSYQIKALNVLKEMNDSSGTARLTALVAGTYGTIYDDSGEKMYLDSVLYYLKIALPLAKATNNRKALIHSYDLLAGYYNAIGEDERALLYCDSAMSALNRKSDKVTMIRVYGTQSASWLALDNPQQALKYADSAVALSEEWGQVDLIIASLAFQMKALVKLNRFEEAFQAQSRMTHLNDSLASLERTNIINTLEQKYDKARNEEEIERLNHEAEVKSLRIDILILGIMVLVVLLGVIAVLFRQRSMKAAQENLQAELRLNRARMNPHFFFNALTTLQTFSMKKGNEDKVPLYLARYAKVMRQTLESTYSELVSVQEEIDYITGYLEVQKLVHPDNFDFVIEASEFDTDAFLVPSMIVQPFLENSIEHGFKNIDYKGELKIVFSVRDNSLVVEVLDNGTASIGESNHEGYPSRAGKIIEERLRLLDKLRGSKSEIKVGFTNEKRGFSARVKLPLIQS